MTTCWIDCPLPTTRDRPGRLALAATRRRPARPPQAPPTHPIRPAPAPPARPPCPADAGAPGPVALPSRLARLGRRVTVALLGTLALLAGVAMLVLPGPGLLTIALGFGILGREYAWAARVSTTLRARLAATTDTVRQSLRR